MYQNVLNWLLSRTIRVDYSKRHLANAQKYLPTRFTGIRTLYASILMQHFLTENHG